MAHLQIFSGILQQYQEKDTINIYFITAAVVYMLVSSLKFK